MEKGIQEAIFLRENLGTTGVQIIDDVDARLAIAAKENQAAIQRVRQHIAKMKATKAN